MKGIEDASDDPGMSSGLRLIGGFVVCAFGFGSPGRAGAPGPATVTLNPLGTRLSFAHPESPVEVHDQEGVNAATLPRRGGA